MSKIPTSWGQVKPGDIVSFRYQSIDPTKKPRMQTVLILNPKFPNTLKDGTKKFYINGLKLEESNIRVLTSYGQTWRILDKIGDVEIVDLKNEIYKVNLPANLIGARGAKARVLKKLLVGGTGKLVKYRSYIWEIAKVKGVFLEPIKLPKDKIKLMMEQQGLEDED